MVRGKEAWPARLSPGVLWTQLFQLSILLAPVLSNSQGSLESDFQRGYDTHIAPISANGPVRAPDGEYFLVTLQLDRDGCGYINLNEEAENRLPIPPPERASYTVHRFIDPTIHEDEVAEAPSGAAFPSNVTDNVAATLEGAADATSQGLGDAADAANNTVTGHVRHSTLESPLSSTRVQELCGALQTVPQSTEHLAWALYDQDTACMDVLEGRKRENSFGKKLGLDYVPTDSLQAAAFLYHTCEDVTWQQQGELYGPVDTYVYFFNQCTAKNLTLLVTRLPDEEAGAEEYCDRLEHQNDGELATTVITYVGLLFGYTSLSLGVVLATMCCTCWCCCARPGWCDCIATRASVNCYTCWGDCLHTFGCSWILGKAGGMQFYTTETRSSLLFWTFAAQCMQSLISVNYPVFDRDDVLDPDSQDSRHTWGVGIEHWGTVGGIVLVQFAVKLFYAMATSVTPFGALLLNFSDVLRDPSFRAKAAVAGTMIICGGVYSCCSIIDSWRYYDLWLCKGHQIVLQGGLAVCEIMSLVSFSMFVHRARTKRAAVAKAHGGVLPSHSEMPANATQQVAAVKPPVATVAQPPMPVQDTPVEVHPLHPGSSTRHPVDSEHGAGEQSDVDSLALPALPDTAVQATGGTVMNHNEVNPLYDNADSAVAVHDGANDGLSLLSPAPPAAPVTTQSTSRRSQAWDNVLSAVHAVPAEVAVGAQRGRHMPHACCEGIEEHASRAYDMPKRFIPVSGHTPVAPSHASHSTAGSGIPRGVRSLKGRLTASFKSKKQPQQARAVKQPHIKLENIPGAGRSNTSSERPKPTRGVMTLFRRLWDAVREDRETGFRYSMFVSASLLVTFLTLTAALQLALWRVRFLADCTQQDSQCLSDVQQWVYEHLLQNFVQVDLNTLKLQGTKMCDGTVQLEAGGATALQSLGFGQGGAAFGGLNPQQLESQCQAVGALENAQGCVDDPTIECDTTRHPQWLKDARWPVLIGGYIGFIVAYCIGLYTIFNVAKSYKKLQMKLKMGKLAAAVWRGSSTEAGARASKIAATYTDGGNASVNAMGMAKSRVGKDILEDYKLVQMGHSAYFTGMLVSTCFIQLYLAGGLVGSVMALLLHPEWWRLVHKHIWWPISIAFIVLWHLTSQLLLNRVVTDGKRIKWPFVWLFLYVGLSAAYCVVGLLLALKRMVLLTLTSILALSRLDACLFTMMRDSDQGYKSFLALALMLYSFQKCLKEHTISKKDGKNKVERTRKLTMAKAAQLWRAKVAAARLRRAATPSSTGSHPSIAPPEQHVSTGGTPNYKAPISRGRASGASAIP